MKKTLLVAAVVLGIALPLNVFAVTYSPGIITEDTTWTKEAGPYIVDTLVIPEGATLTILPGTVVKLGQPGCNCYENIWVDGRLVVGAREATERAVITSIKDDLGGDSNGDGSASSPQAGDWRQIYVNGNGVLELAHADVRYGGYAESPHIYFNPDNVRQINNLGTVMMDDADIGYGYTANYRQGYGGTTTIQHSSIHDAYLGTVSMGLDIYAGTVAIHDSSIQGNRDYGLYNRSADTIDATGNYWGDPSGPTHPSNPGGTGDRVSDNVDFGGFLRCDPLATEGADWCASNVLFLPGLQASRLYEPRPCDEDGCTTQLWEPAGDVLVRRLFLTEDGTSTNDGVQTGDIVDEAFGFGPNIYETFIDTMNDLRSNGAIHDWAAAPYDWRFSPQEILRRGVLVQNGISYLTPTSSPYILSELHRLAASSRTGKVTIIAHSYGGIIAKELLRQVGDEGAIRLVDRLILVASPQTGTPQAIGGLLHGFDQGIPSGLPLLLKESTARELGENMPGAYALLPSARYFADVATPAATFANSSPILTYAFERYGGLLNNPTELHDFLLGEEGRIEPAEEDTLTPNVLNEALLTDAEVSHAILDSWIPPHGIEVIQIAGWGIDTLAGLSYSQKKRGDVYSWRFRPELVEDGDGTVVVPSALAMSASAENVTNWWVNLQDYDSLTRVGRSHPDILEVEGVRGIIKNMLIGDINDLPAYISTSSPLVDNQKKKLRFFLHSPLSLDLYDSEGNHTGISTTTNTIDHEIPGAYYREFGEVKYITAPAGTALRLVLNGQASGFFDLEIEEVVGDTVVASTTFVDIPSATSTVVTMEFSDGTIVNAGALIVDEDGDGNADLSLEPKLNDTVTVPPPFVYDFSGFLQPVNDIAYHSEEVPSVFKGGSTVPVKFQLLTATGAPTQAKIAPLWLAPERGAPMTASIDESVIAVTATNGDSYRWDSTAEQYIYNWSTKGILRGYWYRIFAKLNDGEIHSVVVGVR